MQLSEFDTTGNYRSLSRFPEVMERRIGICTSN